MTKYQSKPLDFSKLKTVSLHGRGGKVRVIKAGPRPVELRAAYLSRDLQLFPLLDEDKKYNRDLDQFAKQKDQSFQRRRR